MSYSGSIWRNPSQDLSCWRPCQSCFRCADKGSKAMCNQCSGRHDPELKRDPYDRDDRCRCTEGLIQLRKKNGELLRAPIPRDPFGGTTKAAPTKKSQDERDWEAYLEEQRERRGDPNWNPVEVTDE